MKAVVTHIAGRHAVLLRQDGTFARVKNRGYRVGQQIGAIRTRRPVLRPLLAMASVLLILFSATALAANFLPFSYVSVDVNPSLTMQLNWFNRVLAVEAVNADAEGIAQRLTEDGIVGQPVGDAVQRVFAALEAEGFISAEEDNAVAVAVASYGIKDVSPVLNQLSQMQAIESSGAILNVRTVEADRGMIAEARAMGTTAGKLAMVKPIAGDSAEETRAWLRRSVREIFAADQGGADPGEITLTIETEPPVKETEPPQTVTPGTAEPAGHYGGDLSPFPQPLPAAGSQGDGQSGPSQTPLYTPMSTPQNIPKNTQKTTPAPTPAATPTDTLKPTPKPTPKPTSKSTPQNTPQNTPINTPKPTASSASPAPVNMEPGYAADDSGGHPGTTAEPSGNKQGNGN